MTLSLFKILQRLSLFLLWILHDLAFCRKPSMIWQDFANHISQCFRHLSVNVLLFVGLPFCFLTALGASRFNSTKCPGTCPLWSAAFAGIHPCHMCMLPIIKHVISFTNVTNLVYSEMIATISMLESKRLLNR